MEKKSPECNGLLMDVIYNNIHFKIILNKVDMYTFLIYSVQ